MDLWEISRCVVTAAKQHVTAAKLKHKTIEDTVGIRNPTTANEHKLRRLSTCYSYSELQNVWISRSTVITCSYDLYVFNKSSYQSKRLLYSVTRDRIIILRYTYSEMKYWMIVDIFDCGELSAHVKLRYWWQCNLFLLMILYNSAWPRFLEEQI
jgi:hypothetical protein